METLPSGLHETMADEEELARFLTSSSLFNATIVKPAAFLPNPKDGKTSVFRHGGEPRQDLWQMGIDHVIGEQRSLHGAAIFKVKHVRAAGLNVLAKEPPPRHANITDWLWTSSDPDMGRAERKERALLIAQHAELIRK